MDNLTKNLSQKFWSHGTLNGALGPLSREDVILGFVSHQILVIWGPYESLVVVTFVTQAENQKTAAAWCVMLVFYPHYSFRTTYTGCSSARVIRNSSGKACNG